MYTRAPVCLSVCPSRLFCVSFALLCACVAILRLGRISAEHTQTHSLDELQREIAF